MLHRVVTPQDCCLPPRAERRLSRVARTSRLSFQTTTIPISGLHDAAYILATPSFVHPLATLPVVFALVERDKNARGFATDLPTSL